MLSSRLTKTNHNKRNRKKNRNVPVTFFIDLKSEFKENLTYLSILWNNKQLIYRAISYYYRADLLSHLAGLC